VLKGSEDIIVLQLLTKAIKFAGEGKSLRLKSVVASGVKGFIYVEADNEPDVREALNGLRKVFQSKIKMVPIKDMTRYIQTHYFVPLHVNTVIQYDLT
jgi:transcription elongation factor SPT5